MTQEQKAQLLLAIDRAEGPGACSYKGGCVIAQLADIVDPSGETRAFFGKRDDTGIDAQIRLPGFGDVDPKWLRALQTYWDMCGNDLRCPVEYKTATPDEARAKMRALVENA